MLKQCIDDEVEYLIVNLQQKIKKKERIIKK